VEARRDDRHRGAHRRYDQPCDRKVDVALADHHGRPCGDRVGGELVPVARGAGHAEEKGARRHIAAMTGDAADADAGVAAHLRAGKPLGKVGELHAV